MVRPSLFAVLAIVASVSATTNCGAGNNCPAEAPCCSQYGECGVGAYCLGGCDPRFSNSLDSCVPAPVCKSKAYTFNNNDTIMSKDTYLGDSSKTDWVMDGDALIFENTVLLTMAPNTVGTVLATSTYMWYGTVTARFKTSRGQGVVTAFILFSDVKDEIDYEFVGSDLETAQSNYYHQGITNYHNELNISLSDTFDNYHTYEIRWTPDDITWLVDGQVGRVKNRKDTWNATSNQWDFPQTPARVQLSLWPGGLATNAEGTIAWAGGLIDWDSPDIKQYGYYYAQFESVTVDCYNASSPPGTNLHVSYTYDNEVGTNDTVVDGDKPTVLSTILGTGTNLTAGSAPSGVATVPGNGNGTGPGQNPSSGGNGNTGNFTGDSGTNTGGNTGGGNGGNGGNDGNTGVSSSTDTGTAATSTATGFTQGGSGTGKSAATRLALERGSSSLGGSIFAGIVAVAVLLLL